MATISDGTTTIAPDLVTEYETAQASRNVVHAIIGRPDPDVSLAPAALRKGRIGLFFETLDAAHSARQLHARAAVFLYTDPDLPSLSMRYVIDGQIGQVLNDAELGMWGVTVEYQEVSS